MAFRNGTPFTTEVEIFPSFLRFIAFFATVAIKDWLQGLPLWVRHPSYALVFRVISGSRRFPFLRFFFLTACNHPKFYIQIKTPSLHHSVRPL